jgi:hypothetical protein
LRYGFVGPSITEPLSISIDIGCIHGQRAHHAHLLNRFTVENILQKVEHLAVFYR